MKFFFKATQVKTYKAIFSVNGIISALCMCTFTVSSFSQVTIILENANTFPDSIKNNIYVAGNFNDWNAGLNDYHLKNTNGVLQVTFTPPDNFSYIEFKFTRGDWQTGEVLKNGDFKQNRTEQYKPGIVLKETIESFQDIAPKKLTLPNENVIQFKVYAQELNREKNIRVYLPCDYNTSKNNYPVLYMLDGQNLFDDVTAYSGEWGIDESMDSICKLKNYPVSIVVGIDHAGEKRFTEYSPFFMNEQYGGGQGDEFSDFVAHSLKPKIDSMYRTLPGRETTAIAGSSMGGLESLYILLNHNETFSKGGIFSPAFWTSDSNFVSANSFNSTLPTRIYFIAGAMEGNDYKYMYDMQKMYDLLLKKQIPQLTMRYSIESEATHSEKYWRKEFSDCYKWLYEK